jgi:hypothetical protein
MLRLQVAVENQMVMGSRAFAGGAFATSKDHGAYVVYVDGVPFACCLERSDGFQLMYGQLRASTSAHVHLVRN